MASVPYAKHIFFLIFIVALFLNIFSQEIGLRKSLIDDKTGIIYNNFRTDPAETIFYEVKLDKSLVYDSPKKNAELIYSLNVNTLVEYLELGPRKNFIRIRILDKGNYLFRKFNNVLFILRSFRNKYLHSPSNHKSKII